MDQKYILGFTVEQLDEILAFIDELGLEPVENDSICSS